MPGAKICQPANAPSKKWLLSLMKGLLIIINFQTIPSAGPRPKAGMTKRKFEISPFTLYT
jgi:hypothetical protein